VGRKTFDRVSKVVPKLATEFVLGSSYSSTLSPLASFPVTLPTASVGAASAFQSEAYSSILLAMENHSLGLYGHSIRVAESAFAMAMAMGLGSEMSEAYWLAGLLHDAGKLNISSKVLDKPGLLTPAESDVIRRHPELGLDVLADFEIDVTKLIADAVLSHHERLDASGYPYQLNGMMIPRVARVLAICDSFDAMTEPRSYRKSKSLSEAIEDLSSHAGEWYDADLVRIFCSLVSKGQIPCAAKADVFEVV
jgi:putative nucleotidyltransferase with HDIG domain